MTDENVKPEEVAVEVDATAAEAAPEQQGLSLDSLSSGYIVGVSEDGRTIFEPVGQKRSLIEVLGLHEFAGSKIAALKDQALVSGDVLTHELGKAISIVNMKIDKLVNQ